METNFKSIGLGLGAVVIIGALIWWAKAGNIGTPITEAADYKNGTYIIENTPVTLTGGKSEVEIVPGSASKTVTQYFGNEAKGDLNGDGTEDIVFYLTQTSGGSGTFFYVVAALKGPNGYKGTNAVLIGDRVAPQPTDIRDKQIHVNFAAPPEGAPMTAELDVGYTRYFQIKDGNLVETERVPPAEESPTSGIVTMRGTIVCLPHKDTSGPQTMECAYGLRDENGVYYGVIDGDPSYANVTSAPMNVLVSIEGTLVPIPGDNYYQSVANILVTKITKI